MKTPKFFNKAAVALRLKEPPRRRGLGKKNPARIAKEERSLVPYVAKARVIPHERGYKEVSAVGGINSDWAVNALSEDSDVWQNQFLLRQRSRDLFRIDVYFAKYVEELWANTFGSLGYSMRLLIKETEDRVVYSPEKGYLEGHQHKFNRILEWAARKSNREFKQRNFVRSMDRQAQVQVGDLDLYAIKVISDAWKQWQRREYCTVSGRLNYNEVRQTRLLSAARDGDFFIRHVRDPKINKFGYSQQLINSEWCDFYLNTRAKNGNEIRMGIERDGWGKAVNYYFIKRQPFDWQFAVPSAYNYGNPQVYEKVAAEDIIHYARYKDGDSTRPAPWSAPVIPKSRHLDKYEEAEVVAARVCAMKLGFFKSTLVPEGGMGVGEQPDPTKANTLEIEPGSWQGLPYGVEAQESNPTHPNGNFDLFRKGMLRAWCAGLPGANYNIIANDLEGVNYSSGRLGMLDERELWKMIQVFDIDIAEVPTFEAWLEMSLMTGAIPLPFAKFDKFNKPVIRGRRWAWVDPLKEVQASALQVANRFISRTRVIEDSDVDADFEQIIFEQAEEEMLMEELGMDSTPAIGKVSPQKPDNQDSTDSNADDGNDTDGASKALTTEAFALTLGLPIESVQALQKANGKDMNLIEVLTLIKATTPAPQPLVAPSAPAITVNVPEIKFPPPVINIAEMKMPEQKASIVNFSPIVKVPEQKAAVINVAAPIVNVAPPDVHVHNTVNTPSTKSIKVKRGEDGKMEGIEVEKE